MMRVTVSDSPPGGYPTIHRGGRVGNRARMPRRERRRRNDRSNKLQEATPHKIHHA
jgi:hypothetical protein